MIIQRIRLKDLSHSAHSGAHMATVLLETNIASLVMRASANPTRTSPDASSDGAHIARSLAEDALRQLRRMPEYRADAKLITVLDHAWPDAAQAETVPHLKPQA